MPTSISPEGGGSILGWPWWSRFSASIGATLVTGATVRVVSEADLGRTARLTDALGFARHKFGAIVSTSFLGGLLILLGLLALIVPGIILACGYSVASQVAALESSPSAEESLRRSRHLTNGYKGKALVLWVVSICVLLAIYVGAGVLSAVIAASGAQDWAATLVAACLSLLFYPLISCVLTLFYCGSAGPQRRLRLGNAGSTAGDGVRIRGHVARAGPRARAPRPLAR